MKSTASRVQSTRARVWLLAIMFVLPALLAGCQKEPNLDDLPVSYWADPKNPKDSDSCVHATAQAIVKSGLPYPNFGYEEIAKPDGTKEKRAKTVDVWVGPTRFILPSKVVSSGGGYADKHPMRFWKLRGSLPNFYPVGEPGPEIDGMGSMVDVTIRCSVDPKYTASWGQGYQSNEEGIQKVKERYEAELQRGYGDKPLAKVSINQRSDLSMTEVLFERGGVYNDGQPMWEASYWPLKGELKSLDGAVSGIRCMTRNDPLKRYGRSGWRCTSTLAVVPHAVATIEIYVAQVQNMPVVYEQVKQLFKTAKQN